MSEDPSNLPHSRAPQPLSIPLSIPHLLRSGSKLRLARPEERHPKRLDNPQTEWDLLHGLIRAYREGGEVVARSYLEQHAQGREAKTRDLVKVWETEIGDPKLEKEARALSFGLGV